MVNQLDRYRTRWFYVCLYLVLAATIIRGLADFFTNVWPQRWVAAGLLGLVSLLTVTEPWLTKRWPWTTHLYLVGQTALILALAVLPPYVDYFVLLYVVLSAQVMNFFPPAYGLRWIALFTVVAASALFYGQGWPNALPFLLMYTAAIIFIGSYAMVTAQAETARQQSQQLLADLQTAHRQLQTYAAQVKELTLIQERNRMARELHDSVTHTLFSINMTAEAAQLLLARDPALVGPPLAQLQALAQSALAELRALIFQLRPALVAAPSLLPALHQHLADWQRRDELAVTLRADSEPPLTTHQAEQILRVIQEALHNVIKHANTRQATVTLETGNDCLKLVIADEGVGFDLTTVHGQGQHLGLTSMRERVTELGGDFTLVSSPGQGVVIKVEVPLSRDLDAVERSDRIRDQTG
jgi:signal transduction histidine kinase